MQSHEINVRIKSSSATAQDSATRIPQLFGRNFVNDEGCQDHTMGQGGVGVVGLGGGLMTLVWMCFEGDVTGTHAIA